MNIEQFALFMIVPIGGLLMGVFALYLTRKDRDNKQQRHS